MTDEIPRDPSYYHPTTHAIDMARDRNIDFKQVAETIKEGHMIEHDEENNECVLKHQPGRSAESLNITIDYAEGKVITVARSSYA